MGDPGMAGDPADPDWQLYNACADGDEAAISAAVARGGDPCFADYFQWTALHWVASNGQGEAFLTLVRNATSLTPKDKYGKTPRDAAKGSMKTMLSVGAEWAPSDSRWHCLAPKAEYKLKTARKWTTGRVGQLDVDGPAVKVFVPGKSTPAVTLPLDNLKDCKVVAESFEIEFALPGARSPIVHCVRPGKIAVLEWVSRLKELLPGKVRGADDVPAPQPSRVAPSAQSAAAKRPSSVPAPAQLPSAAAPAAGAANAWPAVANGRHDSGGDGAAAAAKAALPAPAAAAAAAVPEAAAAAPSVSPADVAAAQDSAAAELERRVAQLEEENAILMRQVHAQEKKIELQTKGLQLENQKLRQEIEAQTKKFADQAVSILDMGAKLAEEVEERRRLAATLSSLQGNGRLK